MADKAVNNSCSIYVHWPWCVRRCPYCDFNAHQLPQDIPEDIYLASILKDLEQDAKCYGDNLKQRKLKSIFFGGGTPSLCPPVIIEAIIKKLISFFESVDSNFEVTLEANPGTLDESRFKSFKLAGVNRLSIGVQSFSDGALKSLGRIHDKSAANRAIECALNLGFNVNVDLMHGLPQQTVAAAMSDLEQALAYPINHLSWYQLTLEPNTQFYRKPPELPAEEVCEIIESEGLAILSSRNFNRYEVSAFAKKGLESQHNLNYWRFGDYLGLGPGAHSKLTLDASGSNNLHGVIRQVKHRTPGKYLSASQKQSRQWDVEKNELMFEWALNRLRLWDAAISFETYQQDTLDSSSDSLTKFNNAILQACANNWLQCIDNNKSKYILTHMGQRYLNDVVLLFR